MLTFTNVTYSYDETQQQAVLKQLSLTIHKGEYIAVVGANGSGKSTMLKLMCGLLLPTEGEVCVRGLSTQAPQHQREIKQGIGFVFQNPDNQFVTTNMLDEVAFGLENNCVPQADMYPRIKEALERVGLWELRDVEPHALSGGQKQRLAIACSLALQPELLILDEATSMLDPQGKQEVLQLIKELHQQGLTIITVTHEMEELLLAEKVLVVEAAGHVHAYEPYQLFFDLRRLEKLQLASPFFIQLLNVLLEGSNQSRLKQELQDLYEGGKLQSEEDMVNILCKYL